MHATNSRRWRRVVVYADLNCPFCFALEERLAARGLGAEADWRLVEHAPELPTTPHEVTEAQQDELNGEIEALRGRAPDVAIARPPYRANSHTAIVAVAQAERLDPTKSGVLRYSLFRALWVDGRDIADRDVVSELVVAAGLTWPLPDFEAAEERARIWTAQWRDAQLNRIPSMIADSGTRLLGLSPVRRLDLFLSSGLFSSADADACFVPDSPDDAGPAGRPE